MLLAAFDGSPVRSASSVIGVGSGEDQEAQGNCDVVSGPQSVLSGLGSLAQAQDLRVLVQSSFCKTSL